MITSPVGIFKHPHLTKTDKGTEQYPKPDGEYNVRLILHKADKQTQSFINRLQPLYDQAIEDAEKKFSKLPIQARKKLKNGIERADLYTVLYDEATEEETGEIEFKFRMKASGINRKTKETFKNKPSVFDANASPITSNIDEGSGTKGRVSFTSSPYFIEGSGLAGLTLRLAGAQIIDLVQKGQKTASSLGFEKQEGFSFDEENDEPEIDNDVPDVNDDDGEDDF